MHASPTGGPSAPRDGKPARQLFGIDALDFAGAPRKQRDGGIVERSIEANFQSIWTSLPQVRYPQCRTALPDLAVDVEREPLGAEKALEELCRKAVVGRLQAKALRAGLGAAC
jgi:hypothetical protein